MEKPYFNTVYVNKGQINLNDIMCELRQLMIDDIKTALEDVPEHVTAFKPIPCLYTNNEACDAVWVDNDGILWFGFTSLNPSQRPIDNIDFWLLSHVYNTLQNEGWFNPDNYIDNTEEHEQELVEILLPDSCGRFTYIQ